MPLHDPNLDTIAKLERSIMETLAYIMGLASVAELYGLQGYLSQLASRLAPGEAARFALQEIPADLRQQLADVARQQGLQWAQQEMSQCTPAPSRQEG